ncbi:hypothetical protein ABFU82_22550 [Nocardioides sp. WV_118_6]
MQHATTTLCYVRTTDGVVKVGAGERVPQDALPEPLQRLLEAGAIEAVQPPADVTPSSVAEILAHVGDDPGRAQAFLDAERARRSPRGTLITRLEQLTAPRAADEPDPARKPDGPDAADESSEQED